MRGEHLDDPGRKQAQRDRSPGGEQHQIRHHVGVGALGGGEATAFIAAVVPVFEAAVPAGRELVREPGGQFEFAFAFPVAVEALLFGAGGQIRCPHQAIVEKIFLQDELRLELALIGTPRGLDIKREADRVLIGA